MFPEKLYTYIESEDKVVCLTLVTEQKQSLQFSNGIFVSYFCNYDSDSFKTCIEFDEEDLKDFDDIRDDDGFRFFKSLKEAKNFREQITLQKYLMYQNRLYCQPKIEE